ncbi:MAG: ribosome maturation factor RimM [Pseudomonadota bacterium]
MSGDFVVLGRLARPHGVHGEIKVRLFVESLDAFGQLRKIYLRQGNREKRAVEVEEVRFHQDSILLKIRGVSSREQARELTGTEVLIERDLLPELSEDEYYWTDLIGLLVFDRAGKKLGPVVNMLATGADDLLVLEIDGREVFIPFRNEMVIEVDPAGGKIIVDPPQGLLDL